MLHTFRTLINPHCEICGELQAFITHQLRICQGCRDDLSWIDKCCLRCGLPLSTDADQCGGCLSLQPSFHHSAIPWTYEFPVSNLIRAYKHHGQARHGKLLSSLMANFLTGHYAHRPMPQALLPVPLHPKRLQQRGFNQAHAIATCLGRQFQLPVIDELIIRRLNTASQQGLNRKQRKQNLKDAFTAVQTTGFRRIAIIDDVVTTGTTVETVATQLKLLGVTEIHIWALARTPAANTC